MNEKNGRADRQTHTTLSSSFNSFFIYFLIIICLQELGLSDAISAEVIAATPNDNKTTSEKANDKPEEQRIGPWVKRAELLVKALVEEQLGHHGEVLERKKRSVSRLSEKKFHKIDGLVDGYGLAYSIKLFYFVVCFRADPV